MISLFRSKFQFPNLVNTARVWSFFPPTRRKQPIALKFWTAMLRRRDYNWSAGGMFLSTVLWLAKLQNEQNLLYVRSLWKETTSRIFWSENSILPENRPKGSSVALSLPRKIPFTSLAFQAKYSFTRGCSHLGSFVTISKILLILQYQVLLRLFTPGSAPTHFQPGILHNRFVWLRTMGRSIRSRATVSGCMPASRCLNLRFFQRILINFSRSSNPENQIPPPLTIHSSSFTWQAARCRTPCVCWFLNHSMKRIQYQTVWRHSTNIIQHWWSPGMVLHQWFSLTEGISVAHLTGADCALQGTWLQRTTWL